LSATSTNPVQNKVVKAALDTKVDKSSVDSVLSATSMNTVQNKVITAELDSIKADKVSHSDVENALNASSTNPVQNKVVKAAIDGLTNSKVSHSDVETALNGTSVNPVQNKVVKVAIDGVNSSIENVKNNIIGVGTPLNTAANTVHGAINELDNDVTTINSRIDTILGGNIANTALDTIKEISEWATEHADDYDNIVAITTGIHNLIAPLEDGSKVLSTNDYTNLEKNKLAGIAEGATRVVVDSALNNSSTNPVQNKAIFTAISAKADAVAGKQLSTNDFTNAYKNMLDTVDDALHTTSHHLVENAAVATAIASIQSKMGSASLNTSAKDISNAINELKSIVDSGISIDAALSNTSTNAVQNKVIWSALQNKLDSRAVDSVPMENSNGLVTSHGIWYALQNVIASVRTDQVISPDSDNAVSSSALYAKFAELRELINPENYVHKVEGKGLSSNDFTDAYKDKLNSIAASANNYVHPAYTPNTDISHMYKYRIDSTGHVVEFSAVTKQDIVALGIPGEGSTYANATTSNNGLMTASMVSKLDSIAASATRYIHPSYTSKAAGLYKVTVDSTGHVSGTTAVAKSDITGLGIPGSDTTYTDFTGATSSTVGENGLVPAPTTADTAHYLSNSGWANPLAMISYDAENNRIVFGDPTLLPYTPPAEEPETP
jgi:hypothetical protein